MQFNSGESEGEERGISAWSTPLTRGRMKIFLLKMDGYGADQDDDYCLLLSLMVILCCSLVAVVSPKGDSTA